MSSSRLSQLLRHSKSLPIKLPQNSNLIIRTPSLGTLGTLLGTKHARGKAKTKAKARQPIRVNVNIVPEWRDDGYITLEQVLPSLPPQHNDSDIADRSRYDNSNSNSNSNRNNGDNHHHVQYSDLDEEIDWTVKVENQDEKKELTNVDVLIDYKYKNTGSVEDTIDNGRYGNLSGDDEDDDDDDTPPQRKSTLGVGAGVGTDVRAAADNLTDASNINADTKFMTDDGTIIHDADKIKELSSTDHHNYRQVHYSDNIVHLTSDGKQENEGGIQKGEGVDDEQSELNRNIPSITINAKIPEKCNVSCYLYGGGDITVKRKLEGEHGFNFMTASGTICVDKLRGDTIGLICDDGGLIHVKKSCEAQEFNARIGGGFGFSSDILDEYTGAPPQARPPLLQTNNRFRSKMINVSNGTIQVYENGPYTSEKGEQMKKLDDDDGLSIIDISSVYASQSGEGVHLEVPKLISSSRTQSPPEEGDEYLRKVRVKSNHGHISVHAVTSTYTSTLADKSPMEDEYGQRNALVTLGGVNGSFDVSLESRINKNKGGTTRDESTSHTSTATTASDFTNKPLASNIHVDSLSPGQISVLTCDHGDVGLTLDRKIESDIRLLSSPLMNNLDPNTLLGDNENDILESLIDHDNDVEDFNRSRGIELERKENDAESCRIEVETNAFSGIRSADFSFVEYVHGLIENRSQEPDSRFDVKTKGHKSVTSGSIGKINIEGAAGQALEGFSGGGTDDDLQRPLLVASTDGRMKLESLSWFGAISRRYGVKNEVGDLGRQAKSGVPSARPQ